MSPEDFEEIEKNLFKLVTDIIPTDHFESFGKRYVNQVSPKCTLKAQLLQLNKLKKLNINLTGKISHYERKSILY